MICVLHNADQVRTKEHRHTITILDKKLRKVQNYGRNILGRTSSCCIGKKRCSPAGLLTESTAESCRPGGGSHRQLSDITENTSPLGQQLLEFSGPHGDTRPMDRRTFPRHMRTEERRTTQERHEEGGRLR